MVAAAICPDHFGTVGNGRGKIRPVASGYGYYQCDSVAAAGGIFAGGAVRDPDECAELSGYRFWLGCSDGAIARPDRYRVDRLVFLDSGQFRNLAPCHLATFHLSVAAVSGVDILVDAAQLRVAAGRVRSGDRVADGWAVRPVVHAAALCGYRHIGDSAPDAGAFAIVVGGCHCHVLARAARTSAV